MPIVSGTIDYNGVEAKIRRLGLEPLYAQVLRCVTGFELLIEEKKHANGTRGIRQAIDAKSSSVNVSAAKPQISLKSF